MSDIRIIDHVDDKKISADIVKFQQFTNVNEQLAYAELLIQSGLVPFKKPEQVVMIANLGKALGVSFDVACQNVNNIQGKPALSVHLMAALAKRAGVDWEMIKDCEKVYDDTGKAIDIITSIKFYRFNPKLNRVVENVLSFTWNDAVKAGYSTKDNWKTKTKNMLRARCLSEGFRFVCPDVLMGVFYEQGEMADAFNKVYEIDDEGNAINISI